MQKKLLKRFVVTKPLPLSEVTDRYIQWVFDTLNQDKEKTAAKLSITTRTVYNKINEGTLILSDDSKSRKDKQNDKPIILPDEITMTNTE